jgi:hypothetical protein
MRSETEGLKSRIWNGIEWRNGKAIRISSSAVRNNEEGGGRYMRFGNSEEERTCILLTICGFCVTIEERRTRNNIPLCLPIYLDIAFLDYLGSVINYSYVVVLLLSTIFFC